EARLQEFAANVEVQKLNAETQRGTVAERQKRLGEIQQELERAAKEQDQALQQQAEKRSRLNVLEQLQAGHEGFSAGSLAALKQSEDVLGSLADKINVPDEFVTAIETALGQHLQLVLTEQPESAQEILADLQTNKKGRASVAPLAFARNGEGDIIVPDLNEIGGETPAWTPPASIQLNGVPLPAMAVVESDESVQPLVEKLLGMTRIVRDLPAATEA